MTVINKEQLLDPRRYALSNRNKAPGTSFLTPNNSEQEYAFKLSKDNSESIRQQIEALRQKLSKNIPSDKKAQISARITYLESALKYFSKNNIPLSNINVQALLTESQKEAKRGQLRQLGEKKAFYKNIYTNPSFAGGMSSVKQNMSLNQPQMSFEPNISLLSGQQARVDYEIVKSKTLNIDLSSLKGGINGYISKLSKINRMDIGSFVNDTSSQIKQVFKGKETRKEYAEELGNFVISPFRGAGKLLYPANYNKQIKPKISLGQDKYLRSKYEKIYQDPDVQAFGGAVALGGIYKFSTKAGKVVVGGLIAKQGYDTFKEPSPKNLAYLTGYTVLPKLAERPTNRITRELLYQKELKALTKEHRVNSSKVKEYKDLYNFAFKDLKRDLKTTKYSVKDVEVLTKKSQAVKDLDIILKDYKPFVIGSTVLKPQGVKYLPRKKAGDVDIQEVSLFRSKAMAIEIFNKFKSKGYNVNFQQKDFFGKPKYHITLNGKEFVNIGSSKGYYTKTQAGPLQDLFDRPFNFFVKDSSGIKLGHLRDQMRVKFWKAHVEKSRPKDAIDVKGVYSQMKNNKKLPYFTLADNTKLRYFDDVQSFMKSTQYSSFSKPSYYSSSKTNYQYSVKDYDKYKQDDSLVYSNYYKLSKFSPNSYKGKYNKPHITIYPKNYFGKSILTKYNLYNKLTYILH